MPSIYEMMVGANNATQQGYERGQQSKLARLYSDALQAPDQRQDALVQMARISPDAANGASGHFDKMDDNARKRLGQYAAAFSALPDDQKAQAYPQLAEMGRSLGLPVPQGDYQPAYAQGIQQLAQAFGGMGTGGNVQSTYIDAQGNRVAIMRDGSTQVLGQNAPNNQIIDTGNGFFGVNKGNLQAAPVMTGGAPQQQPAMQQVQYATSDGQAIPPGEQAAAQAAFQAAARGQDFNITVPVGGGEVGGIPQGGQLRSAPKPEAAPAGYRYVGDQLQAIPGGPADPAVQAMGNDNGRNYVITTGPDGTIYRVNKITGQAEPVQGARGGGASMANLDFKKDQLAVQKGTGANQIERGLKRLETAVEALSKNKVFDGGPLDQFVIGPTKIGQEIEQAGGSIMPALTALTRVPGVGSQSDWEGRLNMLQIPSARFAPEVNRRAIQGLKQFVNDLKAAYQRAGIPFPEDANAVDVPAAGSGAWSIEAAD